MSDNVVQMVSRPSLAERYRAAYARSTQGHAEWIEGVLEMASTLYEAREQEGSDKGFRIWIINNDLNMHNSHDRAALINMGKYLDVAREVLTKTERTSLQHIWAKEMSVRFAHVSKPDVTSNSQGEVSPTRRSAARSQRAQIEALAKERGIAGITCEDAAQALDLVQGVCSARFTELATVLLPTAKRRETRHNHLARIYVHKDFADQVKLFKAGKPSGNGASKQPSLMRIERPTYWPTMTDEERGLPSPEERDQPDPDRPGLNRFQGHVARHNHVQIMPLAEKQAQDRRMAVRRVNPLLRELIKPIVTFLAAERIAPGDLVAALAAMDDAEVIRRRITTTLAEIGDIEAVAGYVTALRAALA